MYILGGFLVLGALLDSVSNAISLLDIDSKTIVVIVIGALSSLFGTCITYLAVRTSNQSKRKETAAKVAVETYSQRMKRLSDDLAKAASTIDLTLAEMTEVTRSREDSIRTLEETPE